MAATSLRPSTLPGSPSMVPLSDAPVVPRLGSLPATDGASGVQGALWGALMFGLSDSRVSGALLKAECSPVHPGYPYQCFGVARDDETRRTPWSLGLPLAAVEGWFGWHEDAMWWSSAFQQVSGDQLPGAGAF